MRSHRPSYSFAVSAASVHGILFFLNYFKFEGKSWTSDAMGNGFLFIEETHFSEICLSVDFDWTGPVHLEKCFSENPPPPPSVSFIGVSCCGDVSILFCFHHFRGETDREGKAVTEIPGIFPFQVSIYFEIFTFGDVSECVISVLSIHSAI